MNLGDKYILLDLIGVGGMAEVYRSKLLGDEGFEKLIVIKKLLPQIAGNSEMVRLFTGEAKLAALLQHENIATTYDFGEIAGSYFLAMEYLSGQDLYSVLQRGREKKRPLQLKYGLMITARICEGMDYAHRLTDLKNIPLNIIHRDLTPHNIFITYEGKVKIFDFGVARAEILDNRTRDGVVKGKVSYMSPEQLTGDTFDYRSDIFSIGILLYEMISGERLYRGSTAELIKKCIAADFTPLAELVEDLPPKLYEIVDKALASSPDNRYQSCAEMQADLDDLLFSTAQRPDAKSLRNYVQDLFSEEYEADRHKVMVAMAKEAEALEDNSSEKTEILPVTSNTRTAVITSLLKSWCNLVDFLRDTVGSRVSLDTRTGIYGTSGVVLLLICSSFLFTGEKEETPSTSTSEEVVAASAPPNGTSQQAPTISQDVVITPLLLLAQKAAEENRFITPAEDSAYTYYQEILRISPEHQGALAGMRNLENRQTDQVEQLLADQQFPEAIQHLQEGLARWPDSELLQQLERRIDDGMEGIITAIITQAEQSLAADRLTIPPETSAYSHYSTILGLDPENDTAKEGLIKIADRYAALADQSFQGMDLEAALRYTDLGLEVAPDHGQLRKQKAELENFTDIDRLTLQAGKALASNRIVEALEITDNGLSLSPGNTDLLELREQILAQRKEKIAQLTRKARRCLFENKLTTPEHDSAIVYYNEIQRISPSAAIVQTGYREIANRYASIANQAYRKFEFAAAQRYVTKGLNVVPDHPRLLQLKAELSRSGPEKFVKSLGKNIDALLAD